MAHMSIRERIARLGRSTIVGIIATILDFAILELCVRGLGWTPIIGKLPALTVGTLTQFFGNRHYAFRAQSGKIHRQLPLFLMVESSAFLITLGVFRLLVHWAKVPLEIANALSGSIVYFGVSYPIWHWVFREGTAKAAPPGKQSDDASSP
jgi:putative flippase GtrA